MIGIKNSYMDLTDIVKEQNVLDIEYLAKDYELCKQVQLKLKNLGLLSANRVNGVYGPQTENAWKEFKRKTKQAFLNKIGPGSAFLLLKTKIINRN